jgi:hypothetical protein
MVQWTDEKNSFRGIGRTYIIISLCCQIVNIENYEVVCVNPEAPIAKSIIGLQVNDEVEILFRGKKKLGTIIDLF